MTLADFTNPALIIPELRGRDVATVVQELSQVLQREGSLGDLLPFYNAVLNREFLVSTDWETGMAFPHARLTGVKHLVFAVGRSSEPFAWGSRGMHTVSLVFLIAVPATESTHYLLLVSGLARLAKQPKLVEKLQRASDSFQMLTVLQEVQIRSGATAKRASMSVTQEPA